ncbi:MAG TPA: DMT family transporter [Edaphobacter sp.]|nr:DMT family transporter [Edaphobacter sp.]
MLNARTVRAYAALAVGVIAIAWSAIFVRWTRMPGVASAFYRMFFASVILWPFLLRSKTRLTNINGSTCYLAVLGGAFFAGDVGLYNIAVLHTSAGSATFIGNNAPLIVGLLSWAITRRLPSRYFWAALAIASFGACLIIRADVQHLASRSSADLSAVMASICFALYLMVTERLRINYDTATILVLSTTTSSFVLLAFAALAHISLDVPGISSLTALLGLGLVCQLTGYFCLTYALGHLPATVTSVILLAVAPLTAGFAYVIFGERMTMIQVFGGVLVLIGVWVVSNAHRDQHLSSIVENAST